MQKLNFVALMVSSLYVLPDDILKLILAQLPPHDLLRFRSICRATRNATDEIFKSHVEELFAKKEEELRKEEAFVPSAPYTLKQRFLRVVDCIIGTEFEDEDYLKNEEELEDAHLAKLGQLDQQIRNLSELLLRMGSKKVSCIISHAPRNRSSQYEGVF